MSTTAEVVLLLLAWVASFGLFIVIPWVVVRVVVWLLEADVRSRVKDHLTPADEHTETPTVASKPDESEHRPADPGSDGRGRI